MQRKHTFEPNIAETVISHGVKVQGDLSCDNDVWIDGQVKGNVTVLGNLTVAVNGLIDGDITATNVIAGGQVKGNIEAREKLIIQETGHVVGDAQVHSLAVGDGAIFSGSIKMSEPQTSTTNSDSPPESN